jgi:hypothetical protein
MVSIITHSFTRRGRRARRSAPDTVFLLGSCFEFLREPDSLLCVSRWKGDHCVSALVSLSTRDVMDAVKETFLTHNQPLIPVAPCRLRRAIDT